MLLCNESSELPYLDLVGGNWNAIVSLMERGEVCYSRLYRGRVTYLSRALYYAVKPYRQRLTHLDEPSRRLLEFMRAAGEVSAEEMQAACLLEKKSTDERAKPTRFGTLCNRFPQGRDYPRLLVHVSLLPSRNLGTETIHPDTDERGRRQATAESPAHQTADRPNTSLAIQSENRRPNQHAVYGDHRRLLRHTGA